MTSPLQHHFYNDIAPLSNGPRFRAQAAFDVPAGTAISVDLAAVFGVPTGGVGSDFFTLKADGTKILYTFSHKPEKHISPVAFSPVGTGSAAPAGQTGIAWPLHDGQSDRVRIPGAALQGGSGVAPTMVSHTVLNFRVASGAAGVLHVRRSSLDASRGAEDWKAP